MSLQTLAAQCDQCGEKTFDYMGSGWLTFRGTLVKYGGRKKGGEAVTSAYLSPSHEGELHFCSMNCLEVHANRKSGGH